MARSASAHTLSTPVVTAAAEAPLLPAVTRTQLALGARHSCALLRDGRVRCWGLGPLDPWEMHEEGAERALPSVVAGVDDVVAIDADEDLTCALRRDASIWCWVPVDPNRGSQRPHDVPFSGAAPTRVEGVADAHAVATGKGHACALRGDGAVLCWGGALRPPGRDVALHRPVGPTEALVLELAPERPRVPKSGKRK